MAVKVGKAAGVFLGTYKIAEIGTYTLSGFTRETLEDTEFGDDIKTYVFGLGDGGEVSFSGNYDPTDTAGQGEIQSACSNASLLGNALKFYVDSVSYFAVNAGNILITKCKAIAFERAGLGTIEFTGKVSGGTLAYN